MPPTSIQSPYGWWVAAVTLLIASLSFAAVTSVPILLKPMARDWHAGASTMALVHTSAMLGAAAGSLLLGRMLDRFGFFGISLLAAAATGSGLIVAAMAENLLTLHLAYGVLIGGIGQGAFFGPLAAAVSQWFDRHRALAIAIATAGQSVGGFVLPPLLRWSATEHGWRATLGVYGISAGTLLVACAFVFRRMPPRAMQAPTSGGAARLRIGRRVFMLLGACIAFANLASFIAIGHLTAFGEEQGFDPTLAAGVVAVMLGVTLLPRLFIGQLAQWLGRYGFLLAVSLLHLAGTVLLAAAGSLPALVCAVVLVGLGFGGYMPGYAVLVRELYPSSEAGRRIAEIYFFGFTAAGAGSWVGGWLRDWSGGYALPFAVAAGSSCACAVLLGLLSTALRRAEGAGVTAR